MNKKSINYFEHAFNKILHEDNTAGAGGVFGSADSMGHGGAITPAEDFYATGDHRIPKGGKKKAKPTVRSKKVKKSKKDGSLEVLIPLQRRPFNTSM